MIFDATYRGGFVLHEGPAIDSRLARRLARFILLRPTGMGGIIRLPGMVRDMMPGGPYYWISSNSAFDVDILDSTGVLLGSVPAGQTIMVFLIDNSVPQGVWRLAGGGNFAAAADVPGGSGGEQRWNYGTVEDPTGTPQNYGDVDGGTGDDVDFGTSDTTGAGEPIPI